MMWIISAIGIEAAIEAVVLIVITDRYIAAYPPH